MLVEPRLDGPLLWRSIALSSHSSSQSHRLTSFGDVEITGSRACGLVVFGSCGLFGGVVVLGESGQLELVSNPSATLMSARSEEDKLW